METMFASSVAPLTEQDQIIEAEVSHGIAIIAIAVLNRCDATIARMKAYRARITRK